MQSVINRYEHDRGDKVTVSAKTMVEVIRREGLKVVVNEVPFLTHVFKTAQLVADTVIRASWEVLRAPTEAGFVLCDAPVVVVPPQGVRQVGFLVPGTVTYIPLSRGACLRLSHLRGRKLRYRDVNSDTVALINQNIAANSVRFIMGPAKPELETVVVLSRCEASYSTPRQTFQRLEQNDQGSFEVLTVNPRNYFYLPDGRTP
jgi:Protein of unknown function (DUF4238)